MGPWSYLDRVSDNRRWFSTSAHRMRTASSTAGCGVSGPRPWCAAAPESDDADRGPADGGERPAGDAHGSRLPGRRLGDPDRDRHVRQQRRPLRPGEARRHRNRRSHPQRLPPRPAHDHRRLQRRHHRPRVTGDDHAERHRRLHRGADDDHPRRRAQPDRPGSDGHADGARGADRDGNAAARRCARHVPDADRNRRRAAG